jgi:hypothetical protein
MAAALKRFERVVQLLTRRASANVLQDFGHLLPLLKRLQPFSVNRFIQPQRGVQFFRRFK